LNFTSRYLCVLYDYRAIISVAAMKATLRLLGTVLQLLCILASSSFDLTQRTSSISASIHRVLGSESISTTGLQGTLLSGYLADSTYTDAGCTAVSYGDIYFLNNCFLDGRFHLMLTANSTAYIVSAYTDANCKTLIYARLPARYSSNCKNSRKIFINPKAEISSSKSICYGA
jgi:hypothetical protein